jgi:AraC-like DNA-binding protein
VADYSSAAFVGLIMRQMAAAGIPAPPGLPPGGSPVVSLELKRELLAHACRAAGPAFLLRIGQGIHHVASDPTLDVLRRAADPLDLLGRWARLERYHHSHHRIHVLSTGENTVRLDHLSLRPERPSLLEDLAVFGLLIALLQAIGCSGIDLDLVGHDNGNLAVVRLEEPVLECTDIAPPVAWDLRWRHFAPDQRTLPAMPERLSPAEQLYLLFDHDPARIWPIAAAARQLGLSARNLQRRLQEQGGSYSGILRDARVRRAARAMLDTASSLAEIGYAAGFADQAHFAREFRRVLGASPAEWRRMARAPTVEEA